MEEMIDAGLVDGVYDVTPGELTQYIVRGMFSAGPDRMTAAGRRGIPQVVAPGGVEFIIAGPIDSLRADYRRRQIMSHTPSITLVRASIEEMEAVGRVIAERLSASLGTSAMILPKHSFGWFSAPGQPLYKPEADRAFIESFKANVAPQVRVVELDAGFNDPCVGETAVAQMRSMLATNKNERD